ncbi:MAG: HIT family protein [Actinobacteria bacterium]|nr:HIT family protein [Actinomycetota bacterium]MBU4336140.1 HIT family protein [Actinomycetota bacterium]MCG2803209.1 HIT family protein [Cellulomonas sp.]
MSTVFELIIAGELPGRFVWADESCVAFLTIAPISAGHTLVVPREPVRQFTAAPDELLAHLTGVAAAIGRAQEAAWPTSRAAVLVAGFEVPHLHMHVLPAWGEAELSFANARADVPAHELDAAAELLRGALRDGGLGAQVPVSPDSPTL